MADAALKLAYTYDDAAELVGVSVWTIRRMVDNGELPVVQFRRSKRIPKEALDNYIHDHSVTRIKECRTSARIRHSGGSVSPTRAANELGNLLGLPTNRKPRQ